MDPFMAAAIAEAEAGLSEGGIPIGSVLVHQGRVIGRGHNRRVQRGSAILHGEMDALENGGRLPASVYTRSVLYTTLSPCAMCSGAILLYRIPRVVVGENVTFRGEEDLLRARGVAVEVLQEPRCISSTQRGSWGRDVSWGRNGRVSRSWSCSQMERLAEALDRHCTGRPPANCSASRMRMPPGSATAGASRPSLRTRDAHPPLWRREKCRLSGLREARAG